MLFYDCSTAPSPRRARMFIAEKGLEIEVRDVSIRQGEQFTPDFLAINPRATVPVLVTDSGAVLTENVGIAAYLEAVHPEPPLMGQTADEKGAVLMWNAIAEQQGGWPVAEVLRNTNPAMKGRAIPGQTGFEQIPALAERGMARVDLFYDMLEARLKGRKYLATDQFTLADITCFVFVDFARVIRRKIPEGNPATQDWFEAIKSRPSAAL